uniref:Xeroderma pigmentosum, complementation group C n=1 Tax=Xiphophorus couchianus TaxID=32473 RepID=A0A3B5L199_9TELE
VNPKPRLSSKRAAQNKSSSTTIITADSKTSKYFQSLPKEEVNSEDDFEMPTAAPAAVKKSTKKPEEDEEKEEEEEDDSEDEDDWEEVEGKKKRQAEFETYLRRMMKRYKKDLLIDTHKVHLLCLLANGMFRNRLCSEPDLLAVALSLLPSHFCTVARECIDQNYLSGLLKWCVATFTLDPSLPTEERPDPQALLQRRQGSLSARDRQEMTHLFLLFLRSLQLFCRLVLSLHPVPFKPPSSKTSQESSKSNSPETKVSPGTKRRAQGEKVKGSSRGKKAKRKEMKEEEEEKPVLSGGQRPKNSKRRSVASKVNYKEESNSEADEEEKEEASDAEEYQESSEDDFETSTKLARKRTGNGKSSEKTSSTQGALKRRRTEEEDDEDEGTTSNRAKGRSRQRKDGPGADEWIEVYLDKSSLWVCVDVEHGVGVPHLCSQNATAPLTYVVAVDGDGFLKDLGRKYDPTWMTASRKRRVDDEWWEDTLEPFMGPEDERDKREEKELQSKLLNKPMPTSIAEYKSHPLYALKRHLLKYEALYPSTAAVLGYCRGEPVYSRDCVHTLHSRETWLKEARTVRLGEEPYKMVKGFSNRSRKARMMSEMKDENDLPLFGEWQTEEYQPPIAVDGKVPRNDYGNVYLFKACMIPVGCVHLRLPNLHRVARKLDLDAAPAVTGFDYHGGYSHAVTDGYIVCEENEEVLRAAWVEEQEIQKQKEKEVWIFLGFVFTEDREGDEAKLQGNIERK